MRISHSSYKKYLEENKKSLLGEELYAPILLNYETFLFPFKNRDREFLVISLNHKTPLLYRVKNDGFYSSLENPFFLRMKKNIGLSIIKDLSLKDDDNILTLTLENNDEFISKEIILKIELISHKPNLILLDDEDIIEAYYKDKNRSLISNEKYVYPAQNGEPSGEIEINESFLNEHFKGELENRRKERYQSFLNYINGKIKTSNNKIKAIKNDKKIAEDSLHYSTLADSLLCLGLDLKSHQGEAKLEDKIIKLDASKTLLENIEHFYKRAKKAKETISRSESNIKNAQDEINYYLTLLNKFKNSNEKEADKLALESGMIRKKKEVKKTEFNSPYKINLNGTLIYFGRNASQNDYLSFVMKLDREFTWLHIKDKSGAHLIIANKKPTEKELIFASEISLLCSHATSGEIVYTKKKNVRRGHTLGEAILKNYSVIKINNVSKETKDIFLKAERVI